MELCLFNSALPGWQPQRVAGAAGAVGLAALRRAGYRGTPSLDHVGGRPSLALLRREVALLRSLLSR